VGAVPALVAASAGFTPADVAHAARMVAQTTFVPGGKTLPGGME